MGDGVGVGVAETCQHDVRERMGGAGWVERMDSVCTPPGSRELIVSASECASSAPLMSPFLMLPK